MKQKYFNIFKLTFITYILLIFAKSYITARTWADICLFLFLMAFIYQFIFIVYLRKKENIKFTKAVFMYILCAVSSVSCYIILYYIKIFFHGYRECGLFSGDCGEKYYGIEAIINNGWHNLFYVPYLIFNAILIVIYVLKDKKKLNQND